jgi:hypothetical protein
LNLELGSDAAGTHDAPVGDGFEDGEQSGGDKNQSHPPQNVATNYDACNKENRSHDATRHAPRAVQIWTKKSAHKTDFA